MKKKIGLILLALVMVIGALAGCSPAEEPPAAPAPGITDNDNDQPGLPELPERTHGFDDPEPITPQERAFSAWNHFLELTGGFLAEKPGTWAADFTMDADMGLGGISLRILSAGHVAVIIEDDNNIQILMDMTIDMGILGGTTAMTMYANMIDGDMMTRMIVDGLEMPEELIDADMLDQMIESMAVPEFGLIDITSVEIEEDSNYTTFHLLLDATATNDFIQAMIGSQIREITEIIGEGADVSFELTDNLAVTLVVYGSDDNPVSLSMDMDIRFVYDGGVFDELDAHELTMRVTSTYIFTAFGDDVVITAPPQGEPMPGLAGLTGNLLFDMFIVSDIADPVWPEGLIDTWDWEDDDAFTMVFNPDGTGSRNWPGYWEYFEWVTFDDFLFKVFGNFDYIENWTFTIRGNFLAINNVDVPEMGMFIYIARQ